MPSRHFHFKILFRRDFRLTKNVKKTLLFKGIFEGDEFDSARNQAENCFQRVLISAKVNYQFSPRFNTNPPNCFQGI